MGLRAVPALVSATIAYGIWLLVTKLKRHQSLSEKGEETQQGEPSRDAELERRCTCIIKLGGSACTKKDTVWAIT